MATTKKVRAIQARRQALMQSFLDDLIEGRITVAELKRENAKLIHSVECSREAIKRFVTDYPERAK